MFGMNGGMTIQPPCPLSASVTPFWPILSQLLLQKLNQEAVVGGHAAEYWMQCQYNNFQNPVWQKLATEAIVTLNQILITNPAIAQNPTQQIEDIVRGVAVNGAVCWALDQQQHLYRLAQLPNFNEIKLAVTQYNQGIQSAMTMYNPMQQYYGQPQQPPYGMPNVNMGGNMMNAGMMPGWPGQPNMGMSPQQQQMMMAMVMQGNNPGGQFNPNAFNQQMMNNAQYNPMGNTFQPGNGWAQGNGNSVLNAGRTNTLAATNGGPTWNTQAQQQQEHLHTGVQGANWTASPNANSGSFQKMHNVQQPVPNNFGQSAMHTQHQTVNGQAVQNAPLQPISGNSNVTTITNENVNVVPNIQVRNLHQGNTIKLAPTDRRTVIRLPTGQKIVRPYAYNIETHVSACEVDDKNVIVAQKIVPLDKVKEEYNMDFDKHNTARYFTQRGEISRTMVADPTAVSEAVVSTLRQSYLSSVLDKIAESNDVTTLDSSAVTKLLRDETAGTAIVIDRCIAGNHTQFYNDITNYILEKGVDVLVDSQVVCADVVEINTSSLSVNAQDVCEDIRNATDAVSMQNRFAILRKWIGAQQWMQLESNITAWINNELYTNFGLGLSIDTFAGDIVELMDALADRDITVSDRNRFLVSIANKFFTAYKTNNAAGGRIDDFDIGDAAVLGLVNRYVFVPVHAIDFQLAGGVNCVLVNSEAMPELARLCKSMFTNLAGASDTTMFNYIVTLDGERLQVNQPYSLPYYTLTRVDPVFVNPLVKR